MALLTETRREEIRRTLTPIERDSISVIPTEEARDKALLEIAQRPGVLTLDKRAYPYGKPDRLQPNSNF
jgi:hypothetical protein